MKKKNFNSKSTEELKQHKIELLKEQFNLRMQKEVGQLKKNHMFKNIRRDIARINTIMHTTKTRVLKNEQ